MSEREQDSGPGTRLGGMKRRGRRRGRRGKEGSRCSCLSSRPVVKSMIYLLLFLFSGEIAFSQDQRLFYDLCIWFITGVLPYTMVGITLGPLNHSHWLTLGQRILCRYIKSVNPCKKLRILAEFVMKGYAAIWFRVWLYPKGTDAPRHYLRVLKTFSEDIQVAVLPIFENGLLVS